MDKLLIRSAQSGPPNDRKSHLIGVHNAPTSWPAYPVLCTPQMAPRTSFLSGQRDVISSFSFGACTVQTYFLQSPDILRKSVDYDGFSTIFANILVENGYLHIKHGYTLRNLLETLPS